MARVLVIHHDRKIRTLLETHTRAAHEVDAVKDLVSGMKRVTKARPDVIVVGHDTQKQQGGRLLKYMRDNRVQLPVILVASPGAGSFQPMAMKLGAKGFLEYPVDQDRLNAAIQQAQVRHAEVTAEPPPVTQEELDGNLSMLENDLNRRMKCFAGKNQVYLHSKIHGGGRRTRPRISLKCQLRAEYGLNRDVYYEFIHDVCCGDPSQCEAVQKFRQSRETA